jgi:hypothetical protein
VRESGGKLARAVDREFQAVRWPNCQRDHRGNCTRDENHAAPQAGDALEPALDPGERPRNTVHRSWKDERGPPARKREARVRESADERAEAEMVLGEPAPLHPLLGQEHVRMKAVRLDPDPGRPGHQHRAHVRQKRVELVDVVDEVNAARDLSLDRQRVPLEIDDLEGDIRGRVCRPRVLDHCLAHVEADAGEPRLTFGKRGDERPGPTAELDDEVHALLLRDHVGHDRAAAPLYVALPAELVLERRELVMRAHSPGA